MGSMKEWHGRLEMACVQLINTTKRIKRWVDYDRREPYFNVGDMVLLKLGREHFKTLSGMASTLLQWFEGPFKVLEKIKNVT